MYRTLSELVRVFDLQKTYGDLVSVDSDATLGGNTLGARDLEDFIGSEYPLDGDVFDIVDIFDMLLETLKSWLEVGDEELIEIIDGKTTINEFDFSGFEHADHSKRMIDQIESIERYLIENKIGEVVFIEMD